MFRFVFLALDSEPVLSEPAGERASLPLARPPDSTHNASG